MHRQVRLLFCLRFGDMCLLYWERRGRRVFEDVARHSGTGNNTPPPSAISATTRLIIRNVPTVATWADTHVDVFRHSLTLIKHHLPRGGAGGDILICTHTPSTHLSLNKFTRMANGSAALNLL